MVEKLSRIEHQHSSLWQMLRLRSGLWRKRSKLKRRQFPSQAHLLSKLEYRLTVFSRAPLAMEPHSPITVKLVSQMKRGRPSNSSKNSCLMNRHAPPATADE